jgi:hypothetical protein
MVALSISRLVYTHQCSVVVFKNGEGDLCCSCGGVSSSWPGDVAAIYTVESILEYWIAYQWFACPSRLTGIADVEAVSASGHCVDDPFALMINIRVSTSAWLQYGKDCC